jgi:phosphatidylserine decarboxylase
MIIDWLIINILLGLCISSIIAHPRISNLDLKASLGTGLISGIFADILFLSLYTLEVDSIFSIASGIIVLLFTGLIIGMWRFFRDPDRTSPANIDDILSPADGKIIYIREVEDGEIPCPIKGGSYIKIEEITKTDFFLNDNQYMVGINMSLLDVHVNRAPITGEVVFAKHTKGELLSLKYSMSESKNERNTIIIRNKRQTVGIVQIASKLIAKVVSYVKEGDTVNMGDRIGKITRGSQVDIILPKKEVKILVKEGEQVYAGKTIIAKFLG